MTKEVGLVWVGSLDHMKLLEVSMVHRLQQGSDNKYKVNIVPFWVIHTFWAYLPWLGLLVQFSVLPLNFWFHVYHIGMWFSVGWFFGSYKTASKFCEMQRAQKRFASKLRLTSVSLLNLLFVSFPTKWNVLIAALFTLYFIFWLQLNMFETLKYMALIGAVVFISGHRLLRTLADQRKWGGGVHETKLVENYLEFETYRLSTYDSQTHPLFIKFVGFLGLFIKIAGIQRFSIT